MATYYAVQVKTVGILSEVTVNDVPMTRASRLSRLESTDQVNAWIQGGTNTIKVRLVWPPDVPFDPGVARCKLTVKGLKPGQRFGDAAALAEFVWPPKGEESRVQKEDYPLDHELSFRVEDPPPNEFWPKAQRIQLTSEGKAEIVRLITELNSALSGRDLGRVMKLLSFRAFEMARTHHFPQDQVDRSHREFLEFATGSDGFSMAPLPEEIETHLVGNDSLVWVTRKNRAALLQADPSVDAGFSMPVYLAPYEEKWTVVR